MTRLEVFTNMGRSTSAQLLRLALLTGVALAAPAGAAVAAPGDLDTSFSEDGRAVVGFGGVDRGRSVVLQPDGRIVVAGFSDDAGTNDFAVARLVPDGSLDDTFGTGGRQLVGSAATVDTGWAMELQPDGKIVVAGSSNTGADNNFALARLGSNGLPDGGFGNAGLAGVDLGGNDVGRAVALQADGKVYAVGHTNAGANPYNFGIARFGTNGVLDQSFSNPVGWRLVDFQSTDFTGSAALQRDGKLLVAGYNAPGAAANNFEIARINSDASLDNSFAGDGTTAVDFGGAEGGGAVTTQQDGKLIVAGSSTAGGNEDFAVARLQENGSLDTSFAGDGKTVVDFGAADVGVATALQPDGKILVAGYTVQAGNYSFAVARLQPNGLADTTFGDGGKAVVDFSGEDIGWDLALQPDGKLVVAGHTNADFAVARLEGDPGGPGGGGGQGEPGAGPGAGPPRCAGRRATIVGTRAANRLRGTRRRDVIAGLGGRDTIRALGGNDIVCAGSGNDRALGGPGRDRLLGQAGRDRLLGGPGRDRLLGGPGRDRLLGGAGRDTQRQ
jgi:uncharacterized delta-60 repeat protein